MKSSAATGRSRIVLVINSLEGGGAERVISIILQHLETAFRGSDIYLILLDRQTEQYAIPDYVNKITLDCRGSLWRSLCQLTWTLRKIRPQVVMSFLNRANCANVVAAMGLRYRSIISVRSNLSQSMGKRPAERLLKCIIRLLYPRADRIVAVSKGVSEDLHLHYGIPERLIQVIYNPYPVRTLVNLASRHSPLEETGDYIVSVGRLVASKNFDVLIRAFHLSCLPGKLVILGEGPERSRLEKLVASLNLQQRVILMGFVRNPYPILRHARFAVFASSLEGFPNALAEAMALSLPVIAADCPSGPAEILHDVVRVDFPMAFKARYGILVPVGDLESLTDAMIWLQNDELRHWYRQRSAERIASFDSAPILRQYLSLLTQPVHNASPSRAQPDTTTQLQENSNR